MMLLPTLLAAARRTAVVVACALGAAAATAANPPALPASAVQDADDTGELIGDLVFHADLLAALDRLCPRSGANPDWHGALQPLLAQALTPELRELSRKLGADAGAQLVQQRGGCHSRGFASAYAESRGEYRSLLQRWQALDD
jgi:hypothetical protein